MLWSNFISRHRSRWQGLIVIDAASVSFVSFPYTKGAAICVDTSTAVVCSLLWCFDVYISLPLIGQKFWIDVGHWLKLSLWFECWGAQHHPLVCDGRTISAFPTSVGVRQSGWRRDPSPSIKFLHSLFSHRSGDKMRLGKGWCSRNSHRKICLTWVTFPNIKTFIL